jgi:hypothetical protein
MNRQYGTGFWMAAAFCAALILAAITLADMGTGENGTIAALRVTARLSLLLFWLTYAGGAMATLFGPSFAILVRHGRDFGLSFAAAHLVHIGLIVWLFRVSSHPPTLTGKFILFECIGVVWIYLLAALSVERVGAMVNPNLRRTVFAIGLEYIALVFFFNFVVLPIESRALHQIQIISYLPFSVLIVAGPTLRWIAIVLKSGSGRKAR